LFAPFVKNSQVIPDLIELGLKGSCFDDVVKSLFIFAFLIVEISKRGPENCLIGTLVSSIVEVVMSFLSLS